MGIGKKNGRGRCFLQTKSPNYDAPTRVFFPSPGLEFRPPPGFFSRLRCPSCFFPFFIHSLVPLSSILLLYPTFLLPPLPPPQSPGGFPSRYSRSRTSETSDKSFLGLPLHPFLPLIEFPDFFLRFLQGGREEGFFRTQSVFFHFLFSSVQIFFLFCSRS